MDGHAISFGPFRLIAAQRLLLEGDRPVRLGSRAFDILAFLVERAEEVVGKEQLIARAWPQAYVEESNLKIQVSALRRKSWPTFATMPFGAFRLFDAALGGNIRSIRQDEELSLARFGAAFPRLPSVVGRPGRTNFRNGGRNRGAGQKDRRHHDQIDRPYR